MPGGGDFVSFFRPGGWSFALKNCPGVEILTEKISGPAVSLGGMVTGQIDTCISCCHFDIWQAAVCCIRAFGSKFNLVRLKNEKFIGSFSEHLRACFPREFLKIENYV